MERRKDGSNREVKEWKMRRSAGSQEVRDPESGNVDKRFPNVRMGKGKDESVYTAVQPRFGGARSLQ